MAVNLTGRANIRSSIVKSIKGISNPFLNNFLRNIDKATKRRKLGVDNRSSIALVVFFCGACLPLLQAEISSLTSLLMISLSLACASLRLSCLRLPTFLLAGLCWSTYAFSNQLSEFLPPAYERVSIQVSGQIIDLPKLANGNTKFRFEVQEILGSPQQISDLAVLKQRQLQLSCYRCPYTFEPDQRWHLTVRLKRPNGYASWGAFDYEKYLFRHQVIATGYLRTQHKDTNLLLTSSLSRLSGFSFNQWRWRIKQDINQLFKESSVGSQIILALSIGDKSGLSNNQKKVLQVSGTSHLMAISGLHVGLVFMVTAWILTCLLKPFATLFEWLPRQQLVLLPSLGFAFLYSGLAGFAVSTQRAFIMLTVYVLCRFVAASPSLLKILLITVGIVIIIDPNSILDVGFWLSAGAVLIISLVAQPPNDTNADEQAALSLWKLQPLLWLGMLPLTMVFFGQISVISPVVNLIAVPLFCILLIPLTLSLVLLNQLGFKGVLEPAFQFLQLAFDWVFISLQWLSHLDFATWVAAPISYWTFLAGLAVALVHFYACSWRNYSWLLIGLSVFATHVKPAEEKLLITLLDVGQGLSMVIEQADYTLVYDTGPAYQSGFNTADAVLIPYLNYRGIKQLDTLVISHADNDHIGGYDHLMAAFPATQVLTSRVDILPQANACYAGQKWQRGSVQYQFISPSVDTPDGSNNRSCVLRLSYGSSSVLIAGDIEKQVERQLLDRKTDLSADILLVPHQGSKTSSTEAFIDAVNPNLALIAAGYLNQYGHPHPEVTKRYNQRGIALLSTIESGSIQVEISLNDRQIKSFRESQKRFWQRRKVTQSTP